MRWLRFEGLGFQVQGLGFQGLGFRAQGLTSLRAERVLGSGRSGKICLFPTLRGPLSRLSFQHRRSTNGQV